MPFDFVIYKRLVTLAKDLKVSALDHLKLLYAFIAARYHDGDISNIATNTEMLNNWLKSSRHWRRQFQLSSKPYKVIIDQIRKKVAMGDRIDSAFLQLVNEMRPAMKHIRSNLNLSDDQITAFNTAYRALNRPEDKNILDATQKVGLLQSPIHKQWFREELQDQKNLEKELKALVKQLTKKDRAYLEINETRKISKENQPRYKEYLALRRQATAGYKQAIRVLVRESGQDYISASKARQALKKMGVIHIGIPQGFKGLVDEFGKYYTKRGKLLKNPPPFNANVFMNPVYDPDLDNSYYLRYSIPGTVGGREQFTYTVEFSQKRSQERDSKISGISSKLSTARKSWIADMKGNDKTQAILGLMLELVYSFQIRAGNVRNQTGGQRTYGLSTFCGKHLTKSGSNLIIKYKGKSGVPQKHTIKPIDKISKLVIEMLLHLKESQDKNTYIFRKSNGNKITGMDVNNYIKSLGLNLTIKDFRRLKGQNLMEQYYKENHLDKNASQTQVTKYVKDGALKVGIALGHRRNVKTDDGKAQFTWATAAGSYIPRVLLTKPYKERGLRVPRFITQKHGDDD